MIKRSEIRRKTNEGIEEINRATFTLESNGKISQPAAGIVRSRSPQLAKVAVRSHLKNGTFNQNWVPSLGGSTRAYALRIQRDLILYGRRKVIDQWNRKGPEAPEFSE